VSPVKYELGFYIREDAIRHSHRRENLKSYIALTGWTLQWRRNVSPVKYELSFYIPESDILHSHRRENLNTYMNFKQFRNSLPIFLLGWMLLGIFTSSVPIHTSASSKIDHRAMTA
jgi:hypothetical protein